MGLGDPDQVTPCCDPLHLLDYECIPDPCCVLDTDHGLQRGPLAPIQARTILKASQGVIPTAASRRRGESGQEPGLLRVTGEKALNIYVRSLHIVNVCAVGQTKEVG